MLVQNSTDNTPTAAILIIGNEILSGRTQDTNVMTIAKKLSNLGVRLEEVQIVPDQEARIIKAVQNLQAAYSYVFTTGGIGPTHDDITAAAIAKGVDLPLEVHPGALAILKARYGEDQITEARLKMAYMPRGAYLIPNPVSQVPGFSIKNVYVLAGVPEVMRAMFDEVVPSLRSGKPILSQIIRCYLGEGVLAKGLKEIQERHLEVEIGSYPFWTAERHGVSLIVRGTEMLIIAEVVKEITQLIHQLGGEPELASV